MTCKRWGPPRFGKVSGAKLSPTPERKFPPANPGAVLGRPVTAAVDPGVQIPMLPGLKPKSGPEDRRITYLAYCPGIIPCTLEGCGIFAKNKDRNLSGRPRWSQKPLQKVGPSPPELGTFGSTVPGADLGWFRARPCIQNPQCKIANCSGAPRGFRRKCC